MSTVTIGVIGAVALTALAMLLRNRPLTLEWSWRSGGRLHLPDSAAERTSGDGTAVSRQDGSEGQAGGSRDPPNS